MPTAGYSTVGGGCAQEYVWRRERNIDMMKGEGVLWGMWESGGTLWTSRWGEMQMPHSGGQCTVGPVY